MNSWLDFFLLRDANAAWVLVGVSLLSISAGLVGVFSFLRKQSLVGDAISHALLPGVCLAFLFSGSRNPGILLLGAVVSGAMGLWVIERLNGIRKIQPDAALAIVLSVFYGLGILMLTAIQGSGMANQSGLDKFLFGKAASLVREDILVFGAAALVVIVLLAVFYRPLRLLAFDADYMQVQGWRVNRMQLLLSFLNILVIALGIQAVGVVLMAALLIAPAAAARYWTHHLPSMLLLAGVFSWIAGVAGTAVSYAAPGMPTGPWIVVALMVITFFSAAAGWDRGLWAAWRKQVKNRRKMLRENILKALYQMGEAKSALQAFHPITDLLDFRDLNPGQLQRSLSALVRDGFAEREGRQVRLTALGMQEGARVTRIHRLWELYLTTHLGLPIDHVHDDAEAIEHVITPELEAELAHRLNYPDKDPHESPIPY
jgi:manganese/zinc/iron transport system permease protein